MPSTAGLQSAVHPQVLVVEDDPTLCTFYRSALQIAGYAVITADDGVSALQQIDGSTPKALVLDLGLPRLSGRDVGREVAAHLPQLPIVVVTGSAEDIDAADFACVLRKPISAMALIEAVDNCFRSRPPAVPLRRRLPTR
jgi:DNA-binding response OmpR family regulator